MSSIPLLPQSTSIMRYNPWKQPFAVSWLSATDILTMQPHNTHRRRAHCTTVAFQWRRAHEEKKKKKSTHQQVQHILRSDETRAPRDSKRVNNVRHLSHARTHAHQPRLSMQPTRLHMVCRHWRMWRRRRHSVWQQLRVLKTKTTQSPFSISFCLDGAHGAESSSSGAAANARSALAPAVNRFTSRRV